MDIWIEPDEEYPPEDMHWVDTDRMLDPDSAEHVQMWLAINTTQGL